MKLWMLFFALFALLAFAVYATAADYGDVVTVQFYHNGELVQKQVSTEQISAPCKCGEGCGCGPDCQCFQVSAGARVKLVETKEPALAKPDVCCGLRTPVRTLLHNRRHPVRCMPEKGCKLLSCIGAATACIHHR